MSPSMLYRCEKCSKTYQDWSCDYCYAERIMSMK